LADGADPSQKRKIDRRGKLFQDVAAEWLALQKPPAIAETTYQRHVDVFDRWILPYIGGQPVAALDDQQIIAVLQRINAAGKQETARRTHQRIVGVLQLAKAHKLVTDNVAADINRKTVLGKRKPAKHHAAITDPVRIGQLLRDIDGYSGHGVTLYALKLAPYIFVRPGELRQAEWAEFTLLGPQPQWVIPEYKMKMRRPHIVPLARQPLALLTELHMITGHGKFVFPALTGGSRPMSENTENTAIRRLGYSNTEMTAHGFRSMATVRLNEGWGKHRFKSDWIEMQMAHAEDDQSRAAYIGAADYLDDRRRMMQEWANYLDKLRDAK
jgi:integrase